MRGVDRGNVKIGMIRAGQSLIAAALAVANLTAQPPAPQTPAPAAAVETSLRPTYVLGTNDQITIRATDTEELNDRPYRIDEEGDLSLPLVGKLRAAGLTVAQLEAALLVELRKYVRNPQVQVTVVQFRSDPVFVVGAFQRPGIHPLLGRRRLLDTLTAIGGLQPSASRRIRITRRLEFGKLPLDWAVEDTRTQVSTVEINLDRLMETVNPAEDIELQPYDIIAAQRAGTVLVNGEVSRPGSFDLSERDSVPVTQLIAMAGGLTREAAPEKARILRAVLDTARRAEIPLDLRRVLEGKENDVPLLANDLLVIPRSRSPLAVAGRFTVIIIPALITAVVISVLQR